MSGSILPHPFLRPKQQHWPRLNNNHEPQTGTLITAVRRQGENSSSLQLYFAALPLQNNRILQAEQVRRLPGPML